MIKTNLIDYTLTDSKRLEYAKAIIGKGYLKQISSSRYIVKDKRDIFRVDMLNADKDNIIFSCSCWDFILRDNVDRCCHIIAVEEVYIKGVNNETVRKRNKKK
jgi:hypothetical protein